MYSVEVYGLIPGSGEAELYEVLDLVVAEFETDPMSVQCFDQRTVERAKAIVAKYRHALKRHQKLNRAERR